MNVLTFASMPIAWQVNGISGQLHLVSTVPLYTYGVPRYVACYKGVEGKALFFRSLSFTRSLQSISSERNRKGIQL